MTGLLKNKRGSNLVYVIVLVVLLGILGAAYSLAAVYNAKESAQQRQYQEDRYMVKSILLGIMDTVSAGENPAVSTLTNAIDADYADYFAAVKAWGELSEENQHGRQMPKFSDYMKESYEMSGTTRIDDGSVTVKTLCVPEEDGGRYLEISVLASLNSRTYTLSARADAELGEQEEEAVPPQVIGWRVTKYYEK